MKRDHITEAMAAHTNLTIFEAVISILEGGTIHGENKAATRIIAICKAEQQRQLRKMDDAVEHVRAGA